MSTGMPFRCNNKRLCFVNFWRSLTRARVGRSAGPGSETWSKVPAWPTMHMEFAGGINPRRNFTPWKAIRQAAWAYPITRDRSGSRLADTPIVSVRVAGTARQLHVEYDVEGDPEARVRMRTVAGAERTVPLLAEDGKVIQVGWQGRGFTVEAE